MSSLERLRPQLAPDLELVRQIGEGSVARVYLAREPALARMVAVKVLRDDVAAAEVNRLRFEREAQAAASVHHPNITTVHRVGRLADGIPYIVMEYVEGRTIADVLESRGALEVPEARRIIASVAGALAAAHRKGIVHRDVRPGNVLWETESDRIVLMDFGIAALLESGSRPVSRLTTLSTRLGDPLHMSPEQLRGEPVTQQSDLYGLGVMAYEILTGASAANARSRPLTELRRGVDGDVADIVRRCLSERPEHRPRAVEVYEALMRESRPVASAAQQQTGLVRDFLRELQRRKVYRVAAGYVAAAFIVLQGAQLVLAGLSDERAERWYRVLVALTLAGFPLALVLSWLFDLTAAGIRRARDVEPRPARRRLLLPVIGLAISIAAAFAAWIVFW